MSNLQVTRVELLSNGQVAVTPAVANPGYQYLYRAAAGVEWVNAEARFLSPSRYMLGAPFPLTTEQRFKNLAGAMLSELGVHLVVSGRTEWVSVPEQVRNAIEAEYGV
ncbi:MAG: hypothetical protein H7A12_03980 [Pseudomonadales bacterium]|jgi:hypothetical protein|nr:hypothetical protein [Pseudomonadales bacterium]